MFIQPLCSRCHSSEHFTISCPEKTATVTRQDSALVSNLLIAEGEDVPAYQEAFVAKMLKNWNL